MSERPDPDAPAEAPRAPDPGQAATAPMAPTPVPPFPPAPVSPFPPASDDSLAPPAAFAPTVQPFPPASDAPLAAAAMPDAAVPPLATEARAPETAARPARRRRWLRAWRMSGLDLAVFLRGALLLVTVGVCVVAFAVQLTGTFFARNSWSLSDFVSHNQLATRTRLQMLAWLGVGGLAGACAALALFRRRARERGATGRAARVLRAGRVLWPLMLPALAWPLIVATGWDPMSRIAAIAVLALLTELCVRSAATEVVTGRHGLARGLARASAALARVAARPRAVPPETVVVVAGVLFYALWMSWGTILAHRQFGTAAADLGTYDTMFFNALHGRLFRSPALFPKGPSGSTLGLHAELTMLALLPLYALRPGPETLLVLQTLALASGAIPLYRFAARRLPRPLALVFALAYLFYAPMHEANFYDFHFPPFALAFTLWAVDMLDARRPVLFALFFALALGCREEVALGFAVLGVYLLLRGSHTRAALAMTLVSVAYYAVIKLAVMPHFEGPWFDPYRDPTGQNSYTGAVRTILANPLFAWKSLINFPKLALFLIMLTPMAFLPLRRTLLWMALLPAVPFALVTTGYDPTIQLSFQYVLLFAPLLFLGSVLALSALRGAPNGHARVAGAVAGIAMGTLLMTRVWGAMPPGDQCSGGFRDIPKRRPVTPTEVLKTRDLGELAAKVPKDAALAATETEHPHVSTRVDALALRNGYEGADFILYADDGGGADAARLALASGAYELVEARPVSRLSLLRKKKR
jgi:uncharacterized membrane protein